MSGKGSTSRPYSVPKETFDQSFDRIFGITCKRCGKKGLQPDSVHTCSPQFGSSAISNPEFKDAQEELNSILRDAIGSYNVSD